MVKLTARQRIEILVDTSSFEEIGNTTILSNNNEDSAITGSAKINNKLVFIIAIDTNQKGGSIGEVSARKINHIIDIAVQYKAPIVSLFESPGARIQEGVLAMHHGANIFKKFGEVAGVVPTIAILFGINCGATAYTSALMDFTIMIEKESFAFITGPKVVEKMLGEKTTTEELGGTSIHSSITGLASFTEKDEYTAIQKAKQLLAYLPQHCFDETESLRTTIIKTATKTDLNTIIPPNNSKIGYDMLLLVNEIVDDNSFLEIQENYAPNMIVGFAKLGNATVGIIANQPLYLAGVIDVKASKKEYRFIQICDAYNIPLLFVADSPGFLPGKEQEHSSMIGIGAGLLNEIANARVPKITLIVNKIIGGAYAGMCCKSLGADFVFAWSTAQIAVLGAEAALKIIYEKEIKNAENQEEYKEKKKLEFEEKYLHPYAAVEHGQVDAIISPAETRKVLLKSFRILQDKVVPPIKKRRNIIPMG